MKVKILIYTYTTYTIHTNKYFYYLMYLNMELLNASRMAAFKELQVAARTHTLHSTKIKRHQTHMCTMLYIYVLYIWIWSNQYSRIFICCVSPTKVNVYLFIHYIKYDTILYCATPPSYLFVIAFSLHIYTICICTFIQDRILHIFIHMYIITHMWVYVCRL